MHVFWSKYQHTFYAVSIFNLFYRTKNYTLIF
jgi:hypothetical protein